jgi:YD repeat-containing protein
MILPGTLKKIFRIISALTAGIFLFEQVALAGDLIEATLNRQYQEQAQTFGPAYLESQQASAESLITQKQAVEDNSTYLNSLSAAQPAPAEETLTMQGPRGGGAVSTTYSVSTLGERPTQQTQGTASSDGSVLSITTAAGDIINYKNNKIDSIEKKDGTIIRNIVVDENNNLITAEITYVDGTIQIVSNGKVTKLTKPDGTVFEYSDTVTAYDGSTFTHTSELITKATYPDEENPDGSVVEYFYAVDGEGNILETKLKDSGKSSFYDKNGTLIKVEFNSGKLIEYDKDKADDSDNGILSKVVTEDGKTYLYDKTEETVDGETVYTVKLKEIRDGEGNIFLVEDNNIVEVELADGTKLRNFQLDANWHLVSGEIAYKDDPTIVSVFVENQMVKEINDINGIKTTYHYDEFNEAGDVTKATIDREDAERDITTYTYIKDENGVTITSGDREWQYDNSWKIRSYADGEGTVTHLYFSFPFFGHTSTFYFGSILTLNDGTTKQYFITKQLTKTTLPDGTVYEYYQSGDFVGNVQRSISPDGKVSVYDYKITPEGDLAVYKRTSYDDATSYQSFYTNDPIAYGTNPNLKLTFNLDSAKTYSSACVRASYYQSGDKSVSFSLNFYNQKPYLYYYSYNYQTGQRVSDSKQLDMTINKDTNYTVEYIWTDSGVNVYLYESSLGTSPETAIYTIADNKWNPRFSVSGSDSHIILDPYSSGVYRKSASVSTDYSKPLKGNPIHTSEFTFDENATSKYLYYSIYGNTDTTYDSIYLNYNNGTPSLTAYHYDYQTRQYTNQTLPINVTFNAGITYVIQTKVEDNVLNLYIYEQGTTPEGPVYTMRNATWDARIYSSINGGSLNAQAYDNLEVYKYDSEDGDILGRNSYGDKDTLTYIYDEAGDIIRKGLVSGDGTTKIYDKFNKLLSETKASGEITVYEYDEAGNVVSITPQFPKGTGYTYYDSGAFQGKLKTAILPDGKIVYYDYEVTENGNLKVYKRVSYDRGNSYQSAYSNSYVPSSTNPTLKASFNLDGTKSSSSVYASAYYYNYNDKSVSLYVNIYASKPTLYYYYYDYKTRQTVRDNKELNITINRGTTYNIEYVWTATGVNVYIYDASQARPSTPIYTLANSNWNPRFSVSGSNAALVLDPSSSGTYAASKNFSTDYNNPLKDSPIHTTTFAFNSNASYKSLYYSAYGNTSTTSDSIYLSYYNNVPTLRVYHYDYTTSQYTNKTVPLNVTFNDNVTYIIQTKIENNTLKFYIYESGTTPTSPVYTIENASWDPQIYTNINGGEMNVVACDRLETYEYNTASGIMLDKDVETHLRNKNIIIDDPDPILPEYTLISGAPLVFPDGKTDIVNDLIPAIDFSATLPSDVFGMDGTLLVDSDSADKAYFDVIKYSDNATIREIVKPTGETISYKDGLTDSILSGSSTTSYSYTLSSLNNIDQITVDRDGIRRIYDQYGNLKTLSLDDATKIVYENGQVKEIQKADGTKITKTNGANDMFFRESGELNDALVSYPDGSIALYDDAKLLQLISASNDITDYQDGKIRKVTISDGTIYDWSYEGGNIIISDNSRQEKRKYSEGRLIELEELTGAKLTTRYYYDDISKDLAKSEIRQNNEILYTYTYTYEGGLTLVHDEDSNTQAYTKDKKLSYIIDSKGRKYSYTYIGRSEGYIEVYFPSGVKVRYGSDGRIIDIAESDGTIVKDIVLNENGVPKDFTYIKDGNTYKVEAGRIKEAISKDGADTLYYDNGFVKSVQTQAGDLAEYQYFVKDAASLSDASIFLNGKLSQTSFYNSNNTTYLRLSKDALEFGDGSDGEKHVTQNETLEAGIYNFTSLTVDNGKTLTLAPGSIIKSLGSINIDGTVFSSGNFELRADTLNVVAGAKVIGPAAISVNILSNSGIVTSDFVWLGTITEEAVRDGSTATGYGSGYNGGYQGANKSETITSDANWYAPVNISKLQYMIYARAGEKSSSCGWNVQLFYDGSWHTVDSGSASGSNPSSSTGGLRTLGGSWNNVTAMRAQASASGGQDVPNYSISIYEMSAYASNDSVIYKNQHDYPSTGTFESGVVEVNALELGALSWSQELPQGTGITFQTRTGDTPTPDSKWSQWSSELANAAGSQIESPKGKYIQYRVNLSTANSNTTPVLKLGGSNKISFDYNRPPIGTNELTSLNYVTALKDGITYTYDKDGVSAQTGERLVLLDLAFDYGYLDSMKTRMPNYVLNDTQKKVYLKDEIIISELTSIKSIDGTITDYCQGQVSKITAPDGTIITGVTFDADNVPQNYTYVKNGATYRIENGKIKETISAGGLTTLYQLSGFIQSIKDASYNSKEFEYFVNDSVTITSSNEAETLNNAVSKEDGSIKYIELAKPLLELGTGADGALEVKQDGVYINGNRISSNNTYTIDGTKNYKSIYVANGATLTVTPWDGSSGGQLVINCAGEVKIDGTITASSAGYRGGTATSDSGRPGEGPGAGGGGGGERPGRYGPGSGGGGSYGTLGSNGSSGGMGNGGGRGEIYGDAELNTLFMGSGGGAGGAMQGSRGSNAGAGGGAIKILAQSITIAGNLSANGANGSSNGATTGGAGSGGSIWLIAENISINGSVTAKGGTFGARGGDGRIRLDYTTLTGATDPIAYQKQLESAPEGTFESEVIDIGANGYNTISWNETLPAGTDIQVKTRSGNTSSPDATWSDWSASLTDSSGSSITSPHGRYLQYKVTLTTANLTATPRLAFDGTSGVNIKYFRNPVRAADIANLNHIKVKEGGVARTYDKNGVSISDPADTIDISKLTFDTTELEVLKKNIPSFKLSDAQKVLTIYDKGNDTPVEIVSANQSITYFDQGFATKVVDKDGVTQVIYTYDENKNVIKVEFVDARQKLEENYQKAVAEIVTQKDAALAKLVKAETDARADIAAKSTDIQRQIDAERTRLENEKARYDPNIYDLSPFDSAFAELNDYEARLHQQTQDAYADLNNQVASARARVETDASTAMQDLINNDYNKILADIVQKESSPLIYQYYRKVLGRDPGDSDLLYWTNIAKAALRPVTAAELTQYLQSLPEYADRQSRKQNIIADITSFFARYFSASDAEKQTILSSLGLTLDDVSPSLQGDTAPSSLRGGEAAEAISSIVSWLEGQSLHFGDSAFDTVISLLKSAGINKSFEDIGKDALKVDMLTGVITSQTKGDLLISMYAMRKAAQVSGLNLYSQKLTWDGLKSSLRAPEGGEAISSPLIAHIDGKHYVLVKSIDDTKGTITYIDPTVGAGGQEMTVSRAEFMETWKGYSLSKELPQNPARQLNVTQEKNIRGSGWWENFWKGIVNFFQKIIAPVAAILLMIPPLAPIGAVLAGINIVIQTISFVVRTGTLMDIAWAAISGIGSAIGGQILPGIFEAVGNTFGSIGSAIGDIFGAVGQVFTPLKDVFTAALPIFNSISMFVSKIATGVGNIFTPILGEAISNSLVTTVIDVGVKLGTDFLFKSMNVDPSLANIGSALLSGAIMGMVVPAGDLGVSIVGEALKRGTIAGVEEIGKAVDLDPNITHLAAIMAGTLVGGALDIDGKHLTYKELMESITPNVLSESAYIGITDIGNLLGVDPRISYLAGIGIRSSLQAGLSSNMDPGAIWNSVTTGLLQGVTNIGLNYATQELGISPLLANLGFSAIASGIEGLVNGSGLFENMIRSYKDNTLNMLGHNPTPDRYDPKFWKLNQAGTAMEFQENMYNAAWGQYYWQESVYIAQIQDFTKIMMDQGIETALNTYATGLFNGIAVNSIVNIGKIGINSIGTYLKTKLDSYKANPASTPEVSKTTLESGADEFSIQLKNPETGELGISIKVEEDIDPITGMPYLKFKGYDIPGNFTIYANTWKYDPVYGDVGAFDGYFNEKFENFWQYQELDASGHQKLYDVRDEFGNVMFTVTPTGGSTYNVLDSSGSYDDAEFYNALTRMSFIYDNGELETTIFDQNIQPIPNMPTLSVPGAMLNNLLYSKVEDGQLTIDRLVKASTWQGLVTEAEAAENISDDLTAVSDLAIAQIDSGGSVDLASLTSASQWQAILSTSNFMKNWSNTAMTLFANSISPLLSPGTEMLMNVFSSETFREQLKDQASDTFNGYNLFEQLASTALGNPGSGAIIEQIGARNFWEGIKSTTSLVWDNRDTILYNANELFKITLNPVGYLNDQFWGSDIGEEFIRERDEFFGLTPPQINTSYDEITHTAKIDPVLNYWNIWEEPLWAVVDTITLFQWGNLRWDRMREVALSYYETAVLNHPSMKGTSISGVNTDGAKLDRLTKELTPNSPCTFTITSSFGSEVLSRSNITTEKVIITDTQTKCVNLENWIDDMQLSQDQVLVVDVAGDLPYRPEDLLGLEISDIMNLAMPANILSDNVYDAVTDKAYFNYSQNPNNKYIYMQIISGPGVSLVNPFSSHGVAVNGALDPNAKYNVSVNGVLWTDVNLKDMYDKFLRGEL